MINHSCLWQVGQSQLGDFLFPGASLLIGLIINQNQMCHGGCAVEVLRNTLHVSDLTVGRNGVFIKANTSKNLLLFRSLLVLVM